MYGCRTKCIKDIFLWCECWKMAAVLEVTQHYVFQRGGQTAGQAAAAAGVARMWWASWGGRWGGGGGGCIRAGLGSLMTKQSFQLRPVRTCQSSGFQQPPKTLEPKDWAGPVSLGLQHGKKGEADNQFLLPSPPPQASGGFLVNHTVSSRPTPQQVPGSASILKHHAERVSVVNAFAVRHRFRENYDDA